MFHKNLRDARESRGISQTELAEILEIPVTTYRNYENTLREPSYEILMKISDALAVSTDELLGAKTNDSEFNMLFVKIKQVPKNKLNILSLFIDFLISIK